MGNEPQFTVSRFSPDDSSELMSLNAEYQHQYPKAELVSEATLVSPVYGGGKNIILALDDMGKLAGYIPLYPHMMEDKRRISSGRT